MEKHILVTNDHGELVPGVLVLAQEMRSLGRVSILAPDRNWFGGGHPSSFVQGGPQNERHKYGPRNERANGCNGRVLLPGHCFS